MSRENVLFNHPAGVRVSTTRAYLGGRTYAMANVTSVNLGRTPASRGFGVGFLFIGAFLMLIALSAGSGETALVAAAALFIGFMGVTLPKDEYHINLGSASGETEAMSSRDEGFARAVVEALNQAIILRG